MSICCFRFFYESVNFFTYFYMTRLLSEVRQHRYYDVDGFSRCSVIYHLNICLSIDFRTFICYFCYNKRLPYNFREPSIFYLSITNKQIPIKTNHSIFLLPTFRNYLTYHLNSIPNSEDFLLFSE